MLQIFIDNQKYCSHCELYKQFSEFHSDKDKKFGISSVCKNCTKEKMRVNHGKHKVTHNAKMKERYRQHREKVIAYLLSHPCIDCGNQDIRVLEFDHVRGKKAANVWALISLAWRRVEEEIAKCEVRCSNCHKIRHYMEKING